MDECEPLMAGRKRKADKEFGEMWTRLSRDITVRRCRLTPSIQVETAWN